MAGSIKASVRRIALVTDFGEGIYAGQMRARLDALLPGVTVVDLVHDLPPFRADLAGCLLPALIRDVPGRTLYLCVVDPGVGGERAALLARVRDSWLIGPDNGILAPLAQAHPGARVWRIAWRPAALSASFHGRDWFAPAAARLCLGRDLGLSGLDPATIAGSTWPTERSVILYRDGFGNLMSGLKGVGRSTRQVLVVANRPLRHARTFCEVAPGKPFWYENALGLVEIAVNQGRADQHFGLAPGDPVGPFLEPD